MPPNVAQGAISRFTNSFLFRPITSLALTSVVVLVYALLFSSVAITNQLPKVPQNQYGLNLQEAYADLHQIATRPHPYNSHAIDVVRDYILCRLRHISRGYHTVEIANDVYSNASWVSKRYGAAHISGTYGVSFEGRNILVKIEGSDPRYKHSGGVLFSSHFDSVSTGPGATDDAMGVATLIQLVAYFARRTPRRTLIFNINNGEEDGLHGSYIFSKHPWSKIPDTFLNLEGASAGGRPALFQASSTAPVLSFRNRHVQHPHANVLSSDAFSRGILRSRTDYSIYTQELGMQGLDVAFYDGRSRYHTKQDSIPYLKGHERALWAMMELGLGSGLSLANDDRTHDLKKWGKAPVYFDVYGKMLILFFLKSLLNFNIIILILGPGLLASVKLTTEVFRASQSLRRFGLSGRELWENFASLRWLRNSSTWLHFWVSLLLTIVTQVAVVDVYLGFNPFIVYSQPYLFFTSSLALAYLSVALPIRLGSRKICDPLRGLHRQKESIILQTYIFTWILLLASTIAIGKLKIAGLYLVTIWNVCTLLAAIIGSISEIFVRPQPVRMLSPLEGIFASDEVTGEDESPVVERAAATDTTERTPLLALNGRLQANMSRESVEEAPSSGSFWVWMLQLLLLVPVPVALVLHILVYLAGALPQSLADGSSPLVVYVALSLLACLTSIPIAPFAIKLNRRLFMVAILVFASSTLYALLAFPFSPDAPLKVFFQQRVEPNMDLPSVSYPQASQDTFHLEDVKDSIGSGPKNISFRGINKTETTRATTYITGLPHFLDKMIIPSLPSLKGKTVTCVPDRVKPGLQTCSWQTELIPSPGGNNTSMREPEHWLDAWIVRAGETARFSVRGVNTRACRVYFDSHRINRFSVVGSGGWRAEPGADVGGLDEIRLWSRTWEKEFVVNVGWGSERNVDGGGGEVKEEALRGRVACEWAEYESGLVGMRKGGAKEGGKIPAFEEALSFLPKWALMSKTSDGLVEASVRFSI